jgi:pimeloyl-ACP methyl ester carboxylesterase
MAGRTIREHDLHAPDGRVLHVTDAGPEGGRPILVHHGSPGSGLLYEPWIIDAEAHGTRLLSYDRPGYGGSTAHPDRTVADAATDVAAIAQALGIRRLATWGVSGGGPHALACGALLPELIVGAASLAAVAPFAAEGLDWLDGMGEENVAEFGATLEGRAAIESLTAAAAEEILAATPETIADSIRTLLSPVDAAALSGEYAAWLHADMVHGLSGSIDGWVDDDLVFVRPWGFDPGTIRVPVLLWQGEEDRFVPAAHGRWLAARIPGVEAHLSPDDGHLTLMTRRVPEVHAWLLALTGW